MEDLEIKQLQTNNDDKMIESIEKKVNIVTKVKIEIQDIFY